MFNPLESYAELGEQTATAVNDRDGNRAAFHRRHLTERLSLETDEDKKLARMEFDRVYAEFRSAWLRP